LPLYPDRVVAGQPHCAMMVRAPVPRHRTEVAIYALVAFGWATKAIFFGGQDFGPSIIEQILVRLKLQLLLFQASCSGY